MFSIISGFAPDKKPGQSLLEIRWEGWTDVSLADQSTVGLSQQRPDHMPRPLTRRWVWGLMRRRGSINRTNHGAQSYSTEKMVFFAVDSLVSWWCLVLGRHLINTCCSNQPRDITIELLSIYLTPGLNVVGVKRNSGFILFPLLFFFFNSSFRATEFWREFKAELSQELARLVGRAPFSTSLLMLLSCSEALRSSGSQRVNSWQIPKSACSLEAGSFHFLYL